MDELLFPIAAVAATFFVAIPLFTLVSRAVLRRRRVHARSWSEFGSGSTIAWLVAPTLLPVAWLLSSTLHEVDSGTTVEPCMFDHAASSTCVDTLLLLALLGGGITVSIAVRLWHERPSFRIHRLKADHALVQRVCDVAKQSRHLRRTRIHVVRNSAEPVFTLGLLRRSVILDACYVRESDDDILLAALLHEQAHLDGWDTVRNFIVRLSLAANPLGALLLPEFQRWASAREAGCDGEAVVRGGEPLALAEGILKAARFRCGHAMPCHSSMLRGRDAAALKLRLALLMNGPDAPRRSRGHAILALLVLVAIALPHMEGMHALGVFHSEVERALHTVLPAGH